MMLGEHELEFRAQQGRVADKCPKIWFGIFVEIDNWFSDLYRNTKTKILKANVKNQKKKKKRETSYNRYKGLSLKLH